MSGLQNQLLSAFIGLVIVQVGSATIASTWNECNCNWNPWSSWTDCTATCAGGYKIMERSVRSSQIPRCRGFHACASIDEGWRHEYCGKDCYNGGTYIFTGFCNCSPGWRGKCCDQVVNCGQPSNISNGDLIVTEVTYNYNVTYQCHDNYQLAAGDDNVRLCTDEGLWSGNTPTCVYMASCSSSPCKNNGTCTNIPNGYTCQCETDWEGPNCEIDVAPPVVRNCPVSYEIYTQELMVMHEWREPEFFDARHETIKISKNYNHPKFEFPWGESHVFYRGEKENNGLQATCLFTIFVKPLPCQDLKEVENGFYVCNGWDTDNSNVCTLMCKPGFNPLFPANNTFLCDAKGMWNADENYSYYCLPKRLGTLGMKWDGPKNTNCTDSEQKMVIGEFYVDKLQNHTAYAKLCNDFPSECNKNNIVYHYC